MACFSRLDRLRAVGAVHSLRATREAVGACADAFEAPCIGKDSAAVMRNRLLEHPFERIKTGRRIPAFFSKQFHDSVATASRNDRAAINSKRKSIVNRTDRPLSSFFLRKKRRPQENECSRTNVVTVQKLNCPRKVVERHSLPKSRQNIGMDGLKT